MPSKNASRRANRRWLHAGLFKSGAGTTKNIWYAFKRSLRSKNRYRIIYALNTTGKPCANFNVGRIKADLITWDIHHVEKWSEYLSDRGTWLNGKAKLGRQHKLETLLATYKDRNFIDPFPAGIQNRNIGLPLNVIHTKRTLRFRAEDDNSVAVSIGVRPKDPMEQQCYPRTEIPFSTAGIKVNTWTEGEEEDALQLIADFLTGRIISDLAIVPSIIREQNQRIEAAFYYFGWRIDRHALAIANEEMRVGRAANAFQCRTWRRFGPLRVDKFKGEQVENLLRNASRNSGVEEGSDERREFIDSMGEDELEDLMESIEVDRSDRTREEEGLFVPDSRSGRQNILSSPDSMDETERQVLEAIARDREIDPSVTPSLQGATRNRSPVDESSDDSFDYLPDNSKLKGKAPATRKQRPSNKKRLENMEKTPVTRGGLLPPFSLPTVKPKRNSGKVPKSKEPLSDTLSKPTTLLETTSNEGNQPQLPYNEEYQRSMDSGSILANYLPSIFGQGQLHLPSRSSDEPVFALGNSNFRSNSSITITRGVIDNLNDTEPHLKAKTKSEESDSFNINEISARAKLRNLAAAGTSEDPIEFEDSDVESGSDSDDEVEIVAVRRAGEPALPML